MERIILLNGAPRSGKDTLARELANHPYNYSHYKIAWELKNLTHKLYKLKSAPGFYEDCKDKPHPDFFYLSPREAYILYAERYLKPTYGENVFSENLCTKIKKYRPARCVISDLGFVGEVETICNAFPETEVTLVKITRPGTDFSKDSRRFILDEEVKCLNNLDRIINLQNTSSIKEMFSQFERQLSSI